MSIPAGRAPDAALVDPPRHLAGADTAFKKRTTLIGVSLCAKTAKTAVSLVPQESPIGVVNLA
jgi:hypothetical protein